jgi:hypothetical protein
VRRKRRQWHEVSSCSERLFSVSKQGVRLGEGLEGGLHKWSFLASVISVNAALALPCLASQTSQTKSTSQTPDNESEQGPKHQRTAEYDSSTFTFTSNFNRISGLSFVFTFELDRTNDFIFQIQRGYPSYDNAVAGELQWQAEAQAQSRVA